MPLRLPRTTFLLLRVRPVWERRRRRARSSTCMCAAGRRVQDKDKISLIFRPLQDRVVPEIGGVLWVDAATPELERLEFVYLNLVRSLEVGKPGGEVAFTHGFQTAWIIHGPPAHREPGVLHVPSVPE